MKSVTMTPAGRKCIRGSEMSAYSEKSQELCHILLPDREIHTEINEDFIFSGLVLRCNPTPSTRSGLAAFIQK